MLAMKQAFPRLGQLVGSSLCKQARASTNKDALLKRLQSTTVLGAPNSNVLVRQLFDRDTYTYTYLIADRRSGDALLLDPVIDQAHRDLSLVRDLNLNLKYAVNTHMHADHVTGSGLLKTRLPGVRSVISAASGAQADLHLRHGDVIGVGDVQLETRSTPGHTNGCVSYVLHEAGLVFTGDAVLIRGCGRTDFQEGNSSTLYQSVHSQIFSLPDHFVVLPAHDYKGLSSSTVGEEKRLNPRLSRSKEEFVQIMENLKLDYPRYIDEALPANRACGLQNLSSAHSALF